MMYHVLTFEIHMKYPDLYPFVLLTVRCNTNIRGNPTYPGADPGFLKGGGGSRRRYRIFHKHPPLDIGHVTSSDLKKFEKHPHSWTFTSAPPPLDIVRVTSFALRKIEKHPHSWTFTKGGGPTLGPMLKSLHRGPKGGGSGPPGPPPPLDPPLLPRRQTWRKLSKFYWPLSGVGIPMEQPTLRRTLMVLSHQSKTTTRQRQDKS